MVDSIKMVLATVVVGGILVLLIALMTGSKVTWDSLDEGKIGGSCLYIGFWAKEIDIKKKFVLIERCSPINF